MPKTQHVRRKARRHVEHNVLMLNRQVLNYWAGQRGTKIVYEGVTPLDPKDMTELQEENYVEYLKHVEGYSNVEIADRIKRDRKTVKKIVDKVEERRVAELENKGFTVYGQAFRLTRARDIVQRKARDNGDWDLFFKSEVATNRELQKLGLVHEEPEKIHGVFEVMTSEQLEFILEHVREARKRKLELSESSGDEDITVEVSETKKR